MTDRMTAYPLHVFRFQVDFREDSLQGMGSEDIPLCSGAFSRPRSTSRAASRARRRP